MVIDRGTVVRDGTGKAIRMVGAMDDITKRKRVEEALRRAHDELEARVAERTRDLTETNRQLEAEITERKQAKEALVKSELRFRLMAHATYDAIWDWDVERNSLEWNDGTKSFFGYEPDIVGSDLTWWIENIHPEDRTRVVNSLHAVIESGASIWSSEYQFRCYDGTYAMVLDRGYVVHDDTGKAIRMVGAMNDITERKQAEEAFQESNERLRELNLQLSAAEEAERKGIARELHDQFGQTLTLLKFEISELADGFPKNGLGPSVSAASDKLQSITALVDSTINSVRNITSFLRPVCGFG